MAGSVAVSRAVGQVCPDDFDFRNITADCRGGGDFTVSFEQLIFSILPSAALLSIIPWQLLKLSRESVKVRRSRRNIAIISLLVILGSLQVALLVLWNANNAENQPTRTTLPAYSLRLADTLALAGLTLLGNRSIRPSTLVSLYLFFTIIFDLAQCRTLWLRQSSAVIPACFTACIVLKVLVLGVENQSKVSRLAQRYQSLSPETISGVLTRWLFWWMNEVLWRGSRSILGMSDLFPLDVHLSASDKKDRYKHYMITVLVSMKWILLSAVLPRLCIIGFNYCKPFLIQAIIEVVQDPSSENGRSPYKFLILAVAATFIGSAISMAWYQHMVYRSITIMRGALVNVVYRKTLEHSGNAKDAVTIMSTDVDTAGTSLERIHEVWASPLEVAIGIYLLYRQVGWVCVVPSAIAIGKITPRVSEDD
jgi:ATP-binding cassette, subfamily C (CFTR/MRP), member 1